MAILILIIVLGVFALGFGLVVAALVRKTRSLDQEPLSDGIDEAASEEDREALGIIVMTGNPKGLE